MSLVQRKDDDSTAAMLKSLMQVPSIQSAIQNAAAQKNQDIENERRDAISKLEAAEAELKTQTLPLIDERINIARSELAKHEQRAHAANARLVGALVERSAAIARFDHEKNKIRFSLTRTAPAVVAQWSAELQSELEMLDKTVPTEQSTESGRWLQGRPVLQVRSNRPSRNRRVKALRRLLHNIHEISFRCSTEQEALTYIGELRLSIPEIQMELITE